jgi:hypothetical protein
MQTCQGNDDHTRPGVDITPGRAAKQDNHPIQGISPALETYRQEQKIYTRNQRKYSTEKQTHIQKKIVAGLNGKDPLIYLLNH